MSEATNLPITSSSSLSDTVTETVDVTQEDTDEEQELQHDVSESETGDEREASTEGESEEDARSEDEGPEDEEIEIDFGGNKEKFKKTATVEEAAERLQSFSKQLYGDYIQKTQKAAAQAKVLETRAEELKVLGEASQDYFAQYGIALTQGRYLDKLRGEDLQKLWQEEPDKARMVSDEIRRVEGEVQQLSSEMQRVEREAQSKLNELYTKRAEEGKKTINASIPDFETKHAADVVKYVTSTYHISEEDAQKWALSPEVTKMAYKAMLYDRSKAQAKAPPKVTRAEVPVTAIKGKGTARRPDPSAPESDNLSDAEWLKLRNKQVYGK